MYILFLEKHFPASYLEIKSGTQPEAVTCHIQYSIYLKYFKDNFNYGFGRPRTDVCGTCAEYEVKINVEKNNATRRRLQTELQLHKRKAQSFYTKLQEDTLKAQQDTTIETIAIDFQQNIPYPYLPVGEIFYARQLWLYNFCIYSAKTKKSTMYMRPETIAKRGANEVISCLKHFIDNTMPHTVKKLQSYKTV